MIDLQTIGNQSFAYSQDHTMSDKSANLFTDTEAEVEEGIDSPPMSPERIAKMQRDPNGRGIKRHHEPKEVKDFRLMTEALKTHHEAIEGKAMNQRTSTLSTTLP